MTSSENVTEAGSGPRLVLVRHGQSEGNARNVFTGWIDLPLTRVGRDEASRTARALDGIGFVPARAFSSTLDRAVETARIIVSHFDPAIPIVSDAAIDERDYGELSGLDKDQATARFGAERIRTWRRSVSQAPPGGESLLDTAARVRPFLEGVVLPALRCDLDVMVVAHGNSLRALVWILEALPALEVERLEIATGEIRIYRFQGGLCVRIA